MTCKEFLEKLSDYFDGNIPEPLRAELQKHMGKCSHCEVVLNTVEKTIRIYRGQDIYELELPEKVRDELRCRIMSKCKCSKG